MENAVTEVSFGAWLKRQRQAAGLTQGQLSLQINCSTSALKKLEAEVRRPSEQMVEQLSQFFNIPQDEQAAFLRFARGDWRYAPRKVIEDAPWRVSSEAPRSNLPAPTTSLIGREKEIMDVRDYLVRADIRLITLIGPPGIGKTRLSIEAARAQLSGFPDGVFFVTLAPLEDPGLIAPTVVQTLGFVETEHKSPIERLKEGIGGKQLLLVLDNLEHIIEGAAPLVSDLLSACPHVKILTTSREALRVPGEWVYPVPSLRIPTETQLHSLSPQGVSRYPALTLFAERARAVRSDFVLDVDNIQTVTAICTQLDGLPLAIELIAARIRLMSPQALLAKISDQFVLLADGMRSVPTRQKTLHSAICWSYRLLSPEEQNLFVGLSVFLGGFTLDAADAVFSRTVTIKPVSDLIALLLDKSLLQRTLDVHGEPRFNMLVTIQQFAVDELRRAGAEREIRNWHLAYFVDLAERAEPNLRAFDMLIWLDRLEAEHDNIRVALEWAQESDVEAQLRLASALQWYWHIRNHKNEGIDWLERGLSIEAKERGNQHLTPGRAMIRGKALNVAGSLLAMVGKIEKAEAFSEASLELFQNLGLMGKQGVAYALLNRASVADRQRDERRTRALSKECLALFQQTGDKFGMAQCLNSLGYCAIDESDYEQARTLLDEHLALREKLGDKDGIALAYLGLGHLASQLGNYKDSMTHFETSLALFQEIGNRGAMSLVLSSLGNTARALGDYGQATTLIEEAVYVVQDLGDSFASASLLNELGLVAGSQGEYERATQLYENALTVFRQAGDPFRTSEVLCNLGLVALAQGGYQHALEKFEEALTISEKVGHHYTTAFAHYCMARAAQAQGDFVTARELVLKAIVIFQERSDPADVAEGIAHCLEASTILAIKENQMKRATCLFSVSEKLYPPLRFVMSAKQRGEHDQAIAITRAALGEEAFATTYEEGKKMTLDEAIAYALKED